MEHRAAMTRQRAAVCGRGAVVGFTPPPNFSPFFGGADADGNVFDFVARVQRGMKSAFRKIKIKGDGRCLFRSIAKNLAILSGRNLPENLELQDADALREAAHKVICIDKKEEFKKKGVVEGDMVSYCQRMRSPDFYGGEPEMFVLSELLQTPIGVYLEVSAGQFQKLVEYGHQFAKKTKNEIRVLYNGTNHYDAIIAN